MFEATRESPEEKLSSYISTQVAKYGSPLIVETLEKLVTGEPGLPEAESFTKELVLRAHDLGFDVVRMKDLLEAEILERK